MQAAGSAAAAEAESEIAPGVAKERPHIVFRRNGQARGRIIHGDRLTQAERRVSQLAVYPPDVERPRTRGDCAGGPRPCPWVSCSHHLYLEVNQETGAVKLNHPHLEVDELVHSCALDLADAGPITLERTGEALNLTRERVRQIENGIIEKVTKRTRIAGLHEE